MPEIKKEELLNSCKSLKNEFDFKSITFWDDTFTVNPEWIFEFCDLYQKEKFGATIAACSRADIVCRNESMVKRLSEIGVDWFVIGFESGSQRILNLLKKGTTVEQNYKAASICKKYGVKIVRAGTVATKRNIKNLEKFFRLVLKLNLDEWELYRPIPAKNNKEFWSKKDVKILVDKLIKFRKISGRTFFIANGIPFCSYDKNKVNSVSAGALPEDGHIRFAIDPRGFAKPHYYFEKNIGDPLNILACWNHPFMKKMRNLEFVPRECKNCFFLEKCRGGSRYLAKIDYGNYLARDSLRRN